MACLAMLNGINLPPQFSYEPLVARKRHSVIATYKAVIHQFAAPAQQVLGDSDIAWTCSYCTAAETQQFLDWFNPPSPDFIHLFTGYWGEQYEVLFLDIDSPKPQGACRFQVSGVFTPIAEVAPIDMDSEIDAGCCQNCPQ